jgi:hypothetical protein
MYFTDFDSFKAASDQSKTFVIDVALVGGQSVESSAIPLIGWDAVLSDLTDFWSTKGPLALWKWQSNTVTMIPYEQVRSISIKWIA